MPIRPKQANVVNVRPSTRVIVKPPEDESKEDKFKRLATRHANEILKRLYRLGNLAGPVYAYTDAEIAALEASIREEADKTFTLLRARMRRQPGMFTFGKL